VTGTILLWLVMCGHMWSVVVTTLKLWRTEPKSALYLPVLIKFYKPSMTSKHAAYVTQCC